MMPLREHLQVEAQSPEAVRLAAAQEQRTSRKTVLLVLVGVMCVSMVLVWPGANPRTLAGAARTTGKSLRPAAANDPTVAFTPGAFRSPLAPHSQPWSKPVSPFHPKQSPPQVAPSAATDIAEWFAPGQQIGPQKPGQKTAIPLPYTNDGDNLGKNAPERIKKDSGHLAAPLQEEMADMETIDISSDSVVVLKHHGSYMQQNRDLQVRNDFNGGQTDKEGYKQSYQFMLRLKNPCGKVDAATYKAIDDLSEKYGQQDLRATTRQAFQLHGVKKGDLKHVIATIAQAGGSTLGGCGDINRNIMTPPAPLSDLSYQYVFQASNYISELFKPTGPAFLELWLDGEKAGTVEYWKKDMMEGSTGVNHIPPVAKNLAELDSHISKAMLYDAGTGIITGDPTEPLYGRTYLPRKFKIGVTVPGDNSIDIYIQDIGIVVIMTEDGKELAGYNIMVGGGMGRTHNKETTFARVADHLGYVDKTDLTECLKAILAAQRDHGNREVRANARLKYLVHTLGIDNFRSLVESYMGDINIIKPWKPLEDWKMKDWLGWHAQGDGKLFLGVNVEQGRIIDYPEGDHGGAQVKSFMRAVVDKYNCDIRLTGGQNAILAGLPTDSKSDVDAMMEKFKIKKIEEIDSFTRRSIACPAFPLCGLAQAEAERVMPTFNARMGALMDKMGMPGESFVMRMTGCPNGCARPYMAEVAFVGQGPNMYQVWLGGSPDQDGRTGWQWIDKMKAPEMETTLEPVFYMYKTQRTNSDESFGDFANRVGKDAINTYIGSYTPGTAFTDVVREPQKAPWDGTWGGTGTVGDLTDALGTQTLTRKGGAGGRLSSGPRTKSVRITEEVADLLKERAEEQGLPVTDVVEQILMGELN